MLRSELQNSFARLDAARDLDPDKLGEQGAPQDHTKANALRVPGRHRLQRPVPKRHGKAVRRS